MSWYWGLLKGDGTDAAEPAQDTPNSASDASLLYTSCREIILKGLADKLKLAFCIYYQFIILFLSLYNKLKLKRVDSQ